MTTGAILEPKAVGDIVGTFFVPAYQRGYRWGRDEVGRLLDDIQGSEGKPYYLQPVVVKSMPDGRWELVDGQQRFTTLYLIFQFMKDEGLQSAGANYTVEYETRAGSQAFLQAPTEADREANIDFFHIYGAFERIREWFDAFDHRKQLVANKLYEALFDQVRVIWYEAAPHLDSIELFTRLNVGRIPLTDAELVKALVLARSRGRAGYADKSEQIAAQWDAFERDLRVPEVWSFITGKHEDEPTHIELLLDALADRIGGHPEGRHRPRYYTFETLRQQIEDDPQKFWDEVVGLHSLVVGWYEDRDIFHKVGYLIALGDLFASLVEQAQGLTKIELHDLLDERIKQRLHLTHLGFADLNYETQSRKCSDVLLLFNVETVRRRSNSSERYSFNAHAQGTWSLEHIHAQNAKEMKRDEQLWAEWLRLHRDALTGVRDLEAETRADLTTEINGILADIGHQKTHGIGTRFDSVKAKVEAALSATTSSAIDVHTIANLALLASGDNSALSNSTFEVKRREILQRDRDGSYIPACTRNVFLKYYTESGAQQIHFWGSADRAAYLAAIVASVEPYLIPTEVTA